jgi:hypothetical protein
MRFVLSMRLLLPTPQTQPASQRVRTLPLVVSTAIGEGVIELTNEPGLIRGVLTKTDLSSATNLPGSTWLTKVHRSRAADGPQTRGRGTLHYVHVSKRGRDAPKFRGWMTANAPTPTSYHLKSSGLQ